MLTHALIGDEGRTIELGWKDGTRTRFHAMGLRDNALDDKTRSAGNGQRLITILDIPAQTRIGAAAINGDALEISFVPEQKTVSFPAAWLSANGRHHFLLTAPPLRLPGAVGSPVNPPIWAAGAASENRPLLSSAIGAGRGSRSAASGDSGDARLPSTLCLPADT